MKFGLLYSFQSPARWPKPFPQLYQEALEQIGLAEDLGYDSVWLSEHHFLEDGYCPSVLVAAAAIASRTRRLKIGTGILLLPLYHPVRLAEDAAVVDIISHGRLILGLGQGYRAAEFEGLDIPMPERRSRFEEGLEILRRCWTEDSFSFHGRHYDLESVAVAPKPVQKPHPPLWLAATSRPAVQRAAKMGYAHFRSPMEPLPLLKRVNQRYLEALHHHGQDPTQIERPLMREVFVAEDREKAWEEVKEHLLYIYKDNYRVWGSMVDGDPERGYRIVTAEDDPAFERERICRDRFIIGDPELCIAEIERYQKELGISYLIFRPQPPGLDHRKALHFLELFAQKVIPHFRH